MFENIVRKTTENKIRYSNIDAAIAALELFGFPKPKEESAEKKLQNKKDKVIKFLNMLEEDLKERNKLLLKFSEKISASFAILQSEIKNKKINQEKFEAFKDFPEDYFIFWKDGLECLENFTRYTSEIKKILSVHFATTEEEAEKQEDFLNDIIEKMSDCTDIYKKGRRSSDENTTYKIAGYETSFVDTIIRYKDVITSDFVELLKIQQELSSLIVSAKDHVKNAKSIVLVEAAERIPADADHCLTYVHPTHILYLLILAALKVAKHCYE